MAAAATTHRQEQHKQNDDDDDDANVIYDEGGSTYNIRTVSAPVLRGVYVLLFAKILRTSIGRLVLKSLKRNNDMDCVSRLVEDKFSDYLPMYYPFPQSYDEEQYQKHLDLSKTFDLQNFITDSHHINLRKFIMESSSKNGDDYEDDVDKNE